MDIERLRTDTPGCANGIHLHHCGASLMPSPVLDAVKAHLDLEAMVGGYEAAQSAAPAVERFYGAVAAMLGCSPAEVAYVENATAGWNAVAYGCLAKASSGDRVLVCNAEYASNYVALLQIHKRTGLGIEVIPDDADGQLDLEVLEKRLDQRVALVSLVHVPTNGGLVNPAAEAGRLCAARGVPLLLDACQSAGQLPLDTGTLGCSALTATGRKFMRGPRGTGFLYIDADFMRTFEPATIDLFGAPWTSANGYTLREDARRFENFEDYVAGKIGLGIAAEYATAIGLEQIGARVRYLATAMRERLGDLPGVTVRDLGRERCGIVTFTHERFTPREIRTRLRRENIRVGTTQAPSTRIDMDRRGIDAMVRSPVHYFNTEDEIDAFIDAVARL